MRLCASPAHGLNNRGKAQVKGRSALFNAAQPLELVPQDAVSTLNWRSPRGHVHQRRPPVWSNRVINVGRYML